MGSCKPSAQRPGKCHVIFNAVFDAESSFQIQPLSLPKTTSPHAAKTYGSLAKAYDVVAKIFKEGIAGENTARRLVAETEAGRAIWREVCHLLIRQSSRLG